MLIIYYKTKLSQKTGHFHEKFRFFVTFLYFFHWKTLSICLNSCDLLNAHKRQLLLGLPHQDSSFHFLHRRYPTTQPHNKVFHADCCMADVQAVYSLCVAKADSSNFLCVSVYNEYGIDVNALGDRTDHFVYTTTLLYIYIYIYIYNILEVYLLFVRKQTASVFTLYHFISSMALMCLHWVTEVIIYFMLLCIWLFLMYNSCIVSSQSVLASVREPIRLPYPQKMMRSAFVVHY